MKCTPFHKTGTRLHRAKDEAQESGVNQRSKHALKVGRRVMIHRVGFEHDHLRVRVCTSTWLYVKRNMVVRNMHMVIRNMHG